ncbi:MAG: FAD-dependent oxidoreductase, partial [Pseudomonadota bacterium]
MKAGSVLAVPDSTDIVLIGGGHAHALVLRRWGMKPIPGVRLTLINPGPSAPYTGMLPGLVAGEYPREALEIDLVRLCRFAGARLVLERATGIDRDTQRIEVQGRVPIAYDIASLDIGITSDLPSLPGFLDNAMAAKPLDRFATEWEQALARMKAGELPAQIAVLGAGVAGVELALAMADRLGREGVEHSKITLIDRGQALAQAPRRTRQTLLVQLERAQIDLREGATVKEILEDAVLLERGVRVPSRFTSAAAGAQPQAWLASTGLALHEGFVEIEPTLRSVT